MVRLPFLCLVVSMVALQNNATVESLKKAPRAHTYLVEASYVVEGSILEGTERELISCQAVTTPSNLTKIVKPVSRKYGVDWRLVTAVIAAESNFDPCATSRVGARGLMQLMPETALQYQVKTRDLYDPEKNILAGVQHLKMLTSRYRGDLKLAVAAYNAGEGTVDKYHGIPPYEETQTYVKRVMGYHADLKLASLSTHGGGNFRFTAAR